MEYFAIIAIIIALGHVGTMVFHHRTRHYGETVLVVEYQSNNYTRIKAIRMKTTFRKTAKETMKGLSLLFDCGVIHATIGITLLGIIGIFNLIVSMLPKKYFDKFVFNF